jgi:hypothetical protein
LARKAAAQASGTARFFRRLSGTDHADGKKGPRYRGGRAATGPIGRGRGHSLEDRVFKGH